MTAEINVGQLKEWMDTDQVSLIDVREADEFAAGHIDGAVSIPLSVFAQKFRREDYPSDKKLVLQCLGGVRSMKACQIANTVSGQKDAINLAGGINAWAVAGFPVVK